MQDENKKMFLVHEDGEDFDALNEVLATFDYIQKTGNTDGAYDYIKYLLTKVYNNGRNSVSGDCQ